MPGQKLRMAFNEDRFVLLKMLGDTEMDPHATASRHRLIDRVLHERMLEGKDG